MIDDEGEEDYDDDPFEQVFDEAEDLRKNNTTAASGKRPLSRKYIIPSTANMIGSSKIDKKYIADKDVFEEAQKQRQSAENIEVIQAEHIDEVKDQSELIKKPVAELPAKIKKITSKNKKGPKNGNVEKKESNNKNIGNKPPPKNDSLQL